MGKYLDNFYEYYKNVKRFEESNVKKITDDANLIVKATYDKNGLPSNEAGLMIGKVQSGKTANFLAVSSAALDSIYEVVILIAGYTGPLAKQNYDRVSELLNYVKDDNAKLFSDSEDDEQQVSVFTTDDVRESKGNVFNNIKQSLSTGGKVIITALQETSNIENLIEMFENDDKLRSRNVLIIDDEGDYGSLNGKATKHENDSFRIDQDDSEPEVESTWYRQIRQLKRTFQHCFYLSVTATPYANLLITTNDELSPSFLKVLKPGKGYKGLMDFHGNEDSNKVITINDKDMELFEHLKETNPNLLFGHSLINAVFTFVAARCAIGYREFINDIRGNSKNYKMIVNVIKDKDPQAYIKEQMQKNIGEIIKVLNEPKDSIDYISFYKEPAERAIDLFRDVLTEDAKKDDKTFDEVKRTIVDTAFKKEVRKLKVRLINGDDADTDIEKDKLGIYIGSNMIERGLTFNDLLVSYFAISPKEPHADTTIQRARWFGYREEIFDYMRVYTNESNKEFYHSLALSDMRTTEALEKVEADIRDVYKQYENKVINLGDASSNTSKIVKRYLDGIELPALIRGRYTSRMKAQETSTYPSSWMIQGSVKMSDDERKQFDVLSETINEKIVPILSKSDFYSKTNRYNLHDFQNIKEFKETVGKYFSQCIEDYVGIDDLAKKHIVANDPNIEDATVRVIFMNKLNDNNEYELDKRSGSYNTRSREYSFALLGQGKTLDNAERAKKEGKYAGDAHLDLYIQNKAKILILIYAVNFLDKNDSAKSQPEILFGIKLPNEIDDAYVTRGTPVHATK